MQVQPQVQSLYNVEIHLLKVHVTQPRYLLSVLDRCIEKEVLRPAIRAGDADINAFLSAYDFSVILT